MSERGGQAPDPVTTMRDDFGLFLSLKCHIALSPGLESIEFAYRGNVGKEIAQILHHSVHISTTVNETMSLAVSNLPNNVKGEKLQPFCKIADSVGLSEKLLRLVQKDFGHFINEWFILYKCAHGKGVVDGPAEIRMESLVCGGEQ
jgi:hypothetical protein